MAILGTASGCSSNNAALTLTASFTKPKVQSTTTVPITSESTETVFASTTSTIVPIASETKLPILTAQEAEALIASLSQTNGNCQLPCLWGFTPSVSKIEDFRNFFSQFGQIDAIPFSSEFSWFNNIGGITFRTLDSNSKIIGELYHRGERSIDSLHLYISGLQFDSKDNSNPNFSKFEYYLLPKILSLYGPPDDVLVGPFPSDPDRPNEWQPFNVVLFYPNTGFLVEYIMTKYEEGGFFVGCPKQIREFTLIAWNPKEKKTIKDIARINSTLYGINPDILDVYYKPVETFSQTPKDFYEMYRDPNTDICIKVPTELWPYK